MKKVSVIIPIYNVEKYLGECLDSVLAQTLREIEIICVNDQSPDGSEAILEEYAAKDSRIIVLKNQRNMGLSGARNEGMKIATGEYIYFLDSDDKIAANALERLYTVAQKKQADLIFFDSVMFYENTDVDQPTDLFQAKVQYPDLMTGAEFLGEMRKNDDIREPVWLQFWNRDFLERIGLKYFEGILHEDLLFTFISLMEAERVACINETLHYYRIRQNAITSSGISARHITGLVLTYVEILDYWNHKGRDKGVGYAIEHYLDRISWKINRYLDDFKDCEKVRAELGKDEVAKHVFKLILEPQFRL